MAQIVINQGDAIRYAREDAGGSVTWEDSDGVIKGGWQFEGTLAHISHARQRKPERIIAGVNIPLALCRRLVEDGMCVPYDAPMSAPKPEGQTESEGYSPAPEPEPSPNPMDTEFDGSEKIALDHKADVIQVSAAEEAAVSERAGKIDGAAVKALYDSALGLDSGKD